MSSNLERYQKDIERLSIEGFRLSISLQYHTNPESFKNAKLTKDVLAKLPDVRQSYESWYSEALACVAQLLPDRAMDFRAYYKPEKTRKEILYSNYTMSGLSAGNNCYAILR
jgi:hypothetical protein